jgi:arylformamidase
VRPDLAALAHPADASTAYLHGQLRPSQGPLLEAFAAESEAALAAFGPTLDIPYGEHPRERFDLFASALPSRGTLAYFHAGFWQSRDKAQFRFLAPAFLAQGVDVALVNYPLCPDVTLRRLVESARSSIPAILSHLDGLGRGRAQVVAAGHSAGGHLAVELALTDWTARGLAHSPIGAILPISGIYELAPLLATRLNDKLRLDPDEARALSPLHRVRGALPPAHFLVGGLETPEFRAQTEAMHEAWREGGGVSSLQEVAGADHFSVLRELAVSGAAFTPTMGLFAPADGA